MRLRVKKAASYGAKRIESFGNIDNVVVEENLLTPEKESISIFFRGNDSSGILNFTTNEFESLIKSVKPNLHLVKPLATFSKRDKKQSSKIKKSKLKKKKTQEN